MGHIIHHTSLKLIVCGAKGRMGQRVVALAEKDQRFTLTGKVDRDNAADFPSLLPQAHVVVEFTAPGASLEHAELCAKAQKAVVIGTTGFSPEHLARIKRLSERTAIFLSPNMSPAMNLLFHLAQTASQNLKQYEAKITESHHAHKKDKPSGTALKLAQAVRKGSGKNSIPIASVREGEIVGDHTLTLEGPFEVLELTHRATSRDIFALGALEASLWVASRKPGLYDYEDLMELKNSEK